MFELIDEEIVDVAEQMMSFLSLNEITNEWMSGFEIESQAQANNVQLKTKLHIRLEFRLIFSFYSEMFSYLQG